MLWQYWFTDRPTKRATGFWWRRRVLGPYAGVVSKDVEGRLILSGAPWQRFARHMVVLGGSQLIYFVDDQRPLRQRSNFLTNGIAINFHTEAQKGLKKVSRSAPVRSAGQAPP
jgi:hypothetical protein